MDAVHLLGRSFAHALVSGNLELYEYGHRAEWVGFMKIEHADKCALSSAGEDR